MLEFAALGCSAVAFAACTAERSRGKIFIRAAMGAMLIAMLIVVLLPDARRTAGVFGVGIWVLAAITARQHHEEDEAVRVVRSGSMAVMGLLLVLHSLGDTPDLGAAEHSSHGVNASVVASVLLVAFTVASITLFQSSRERPSRRTAIELWAGLAACALMILH